MTTLRENMMLGAVLFIELDRIVLEAFETTVRKRKPRAKQSSGPQFTDSVLRKPIDLRLQNWQIARRRKHEIRARAYELWEQAGKPMERDEDFWLMAEREIMEMKEAAN
jgi:hypothetical protein